MTARISTYTAHTYYITHMEKAYVMRSDNLHLDLNWNINCCVAVACLPLWRSCCIAFGGFLFIIEPKRHTKAVLFFISFGILECSTTACRAFNYAVDLGTYVEIACLLTCLLNETFLRLVICTLWLVFFYALETTLPLVSFFHFLLLCNMSVCHAAE